ncbi:hypothetical protein RDABS01_006214 [Bienertia sinuspersici]
MKSSNFTSISCLQNHNFGAFDGFQSSNSEFSTMISNNSINGYVVAGNEIDYMQQLGYGNMDFPSYISPVTYSSLMPTPMENLSLSSSSPPHLVDYHWSFPSSDDDSIKSDLFLAQSYKPMDAPTKRSQKLSDKISALQELVSPYGKTDTASVLQEACIYIKIIHQEIRRLSISYLEVRSSLHSQLQGEVERQNDLQSKGLCLVPVSIMKTITRESWVGDHQTASKTLRRPGNI